MIHFTGRRPARVETKWLRIKGLWLIFSYGEEKKERERKKKESYLRMFETKLFFTVCSVFDGMGVACMRSSTGIKKAVY